MIIETINALNRHIERQVMDENGGFIKPGRIKHGYLFCVAAIMVGLMYVDGLRWALRFPRRWRKATREEIAEFGLPPDFPIVKRDKR